MKLLNVGSLVVALVALALSMTLWMREGPPSVVQTPPAPSPAPGPANGPGNHPQTARELGLSVIVLEMSGKNCVLSTKTPTSHGNQNKDAHWLVVNNCTGAVKLAFTNFKIGTTVASPFSSDPSFTLSAGIQVIKAHVQKTSAPDGTDYTFDLLVNGVVQADPDIVIDN